MSNSLAIKVPAHRGCRKGKLRQVCRAQRLITPSANPSLMQVPPPIENSFNDGTDHDLMVPRISI